MMKLFYFNNLKFDVAINPIPTIPIVTLVATGRTPKNISTPPIKANTIPAVN